MKNHTNKAENIKTRKHKHIAVLIAAFITAIAIAVTCMLCLNTAMPIIVDDSASGGDVTTSATNHTTGGDFSAQGALAVGDTFTLAYTGSPVNIKLPAGGTFTLEVWGAQGGKGYSAYDIAGKGGYTKATYKTTAATNIYVVVGGVGANWSGSNHTIAGGYNGGGAARSSRTCSHGGGTGGGATHIALATGLLSAVSSSNVLIVAGGGGGAGNSSSYTGGAGGGNQTGGTGVVAGKAGAGSGYGNGGGTSGGGTGTGTYAGVTGAYGKGGDSGYYSGSYCGGAGGGGGYYGGAGGAAISSCAAGAGGGGSSYVKSGLTGAVYQSGQRASNGQAKITVVQVNSNPTSRSASVTVGARGVVTSSSPSNIAASTIASDPEGTAVAYTAGSSSNYDNLPSSNNGLWLNSSLSTLATNYFDWTWSSTTLSITNVKRYPRSGIDGSTANGKLVLYTRVRDSFGTNTQRGTSVVSFTVTVSRNTISVKNQTATYYNVGNSTVLPTGDYDPAKAGSAIYNTAAGKATLFVKKALPINSTVTINAAGLLNGVYSGDTAVISVYSTPTAMSSGKYSVTGTSRTSYDSAKAAIAGAYTSITIKSLAPDSSFQVLPVRLYAVENTTAYGSATPYCSADIAYLSLDIVFKLENTRPVVGSRSNLVNLAVGETQTISLKDYFTDVDGINNTSHTISGVVIPSNEFIQLKSNSVGYNSVVSLPTNNNFYNIGTASGTTSLTDSAQSGTATGFAGKNFAYNSTAPVSGSSPDSAFMRFGYSGSTLTVVGLRSSYSQYVAGRQNAPGHFYLLLHINDTRNTYDKGIWLPIAFTVGEVTNYAPVATVTAPNSLTGQSASSAFPTASGNVNDTFYFAPMAINANGSHVVGYYDTGDALSQTALQPLAIDGDNFASAKGDKYGMTSWGAKYNEFLQLDNPSAINFINSVSTVGASGDANKASNKYIEAELIDIFVPTSDFGTASGRDGRVVVGTGTNAEGFKYINLAQSSKYSGYYVTKGLKIKLKSATMNRYIYGTVSVIDSTAKSVSGINIAIRVNNTAPTAYATGDKNVVSNKINISYSNNDVPTISYQIPLGGKIAITPYDLVSDADMLIHSGVSTSGGFTLNGIQGRFNPSTGTIISGGAEAADNVPFEGILDNTYGLDAENGILDTLKTMGGSTLVKKVSASSSGTASNTAMQTEQNVFNDKLYFARVGDGTDAYTFNPTTINNFAVSAVNTTNYITYQFGNKVTHGAGTYNVDFIFITATTRTTQPAYIDLTVRDRYGDSTDGAASVPIRIRIDVVNTAPAIKNIDKCYELAADPITANKKIAPKTMVFAADGNTQENGLMIDVDKDTPDFITARGLLIANSRDLLYDERLEDGFDAVYADATKADFAKYLVDNENDNRLLTDYYVTATMLSRFEISVTALSSTKAIAGGVYVYFYVSDGNGGISLGLVQVEVIDSAPALNTSEENGFDEKDPIWTIESTSDADIMSYRYIVGSSVAATKLVEQGGAAASNVKVLTTDADGLHDYSVLSPRTSGDVSTYTNIRYDEIDNGTTDLPTEIARAVPDVAIATEFLANNPQAAVVAFKRSITADGVTYDGNLPENYQVTMMYFVEGKWITRNDLVYGNTDIPFGGIQNYTSEQLVTDGFFDKEGRWIYENWALRLYSGSGMQTSESVGLMFSVRDCTELGGDTAGIATAYANLRSDGKAVVSANLQTTVYHSVSKTGIRTKDEYAGYDNYYVVENTYRDGSETKTTAYLSTYDGDKTNAYTYASSIGYAQDSSGTVVLSNTSSNIKSASGTEDGTKAGANSGVAFDRSKLDDNAYTEGAYIYPEVIEVPADSTNVNDYGKTVYVPMSFFGQLDNLISIAPDGTVVYPQEYVGYDKGSNNATFVRGSFADIRSALVLTDGVGEWRGDNINSNPYITIDAFDFLNTDNNSKNGDRTVLLNDRNRPYFNNRLAARTVFIDEDGTNDVLNNLYLDNNNHNSFVGDGRIMYLEEQAEKLQEHNFGLTFNKKNVRTGVRDLTLTIELSKSAGVTNSAANDNDKRTVSVKIHVENAKLDLSAKVDATDNSVLQYDAVNNTYYAEISMETAKSQSFMLVRRGDDGTVETGNTTYSTAHKIAYTDFDYLNAYDTSYRDSAYFYADSFERLGSWLSGSGAYERAADYADGVYTNVNSSERAQNSVANYFKGLDRSDIENFVPNAGINGNAANGYSGYFNVSLSDNGKVINFMATRKMFINDTELKGKVANNKDAVIAEYAKRGLVADYDRSTDPYNPDVVYYPFKALVFDNRGAGWMDGAYVAVEFRITVRNASPTLKNVGETDEEGNVEYRLNLAVGNIIIFNLNDFIYDPDIYTLGRGANTMLATKKQFGEVSKPIDRETGDYLLSPFKHDPYLSTDTEYRAEATENNILKEDGSYYRNGGGFQLSDAPLDVVMYMQTDDTKLTSASEPLANNIIFKVNNRTTYLTPQGKNVSINEYRFTLKFYDSEESQPTKNLTFIITITNQAPKIVTNVRNITMRSGDDITILATDFTTFQDGNSDGYKYSASKGYYDAHVAKGGVDGTNNATVNSGFKGWVYADLTKEVCDQVITDSDKYAERPVDNQFMHLGYLSLADDDTPWRLRISDFDYYNGTGEKIRVDGTFALTEERNTTGQFTREMPMALHVRAIAACVNEPLTITLSDGEDGYITVILYFTIISSPPVALDGSSAEDKRLIEEAGLETTDTSGVYNMFTVPSGTAKYSLTGFSGEKTARNEYTINMVNIAKDLDGATETNGMTLYGNGEFTVNGIPLVMSSDGVYHADYFDIRINAGGRSFTLTSTGYNPTGQSYETLTFRIADYGNGAYENSLSVTLRVYTLYADMTNPTAATASASESAYTAYLTGSEIVNVKSYDDYYSLQPEPSRLAQVKLTGNVGNDGNTASHIVDPDVKVKGEQAYSTRIYLLADGDEHSGFTALSADKLKSMFAVSASNNTFYLKDRDSYADYLIGGISYDGTPVNADILRLNEINKYVDFTFDRDGTAITFTPRAATLDNKNLLLYIESEKYVNGSREVKRDDGSVALAAGAIYRLNVQDSAPVKVTDSAAVQYNADQALVGRRGDTLSLKIYDSKNPFAAMFRDSDAYDLVTVLDFDDAAYERSIARALSENPDLELGEKDGLPRAFTVNIDRNTDTLNIKINRRVDMLVDGRYLNSVTFPIEIVGVDKDGKTATSVVSLTVVNSEASVAQIITPNYDPQTNVGYSIERNADGTFSVNAQLQYSAPLTIDLGDFMVDPDHIDGADADSYMFVSSTRNVYPYEFLTDEAQTVYWYDTLPNGNINDDKFVELATVTPVGDDKWHRTGFTITATNTMRTLSARTYIRILDRSANIDERDTGVFIILNITIMNDAPYAKEGMTASTVYMIGSDSVAPGGMLFYIGDFVNDNNESDVIGDAASITSETYLRIFSQQPVDGGAADINVYSTKFSSITDENAVDFDSSALFTVTIPRQLPRDLLDDYLKRNGLPADAKDDTNNYSQWFVITPILGYYGNGAVDITVADGDSSNPAYGDTLLTTFRINIEVLRDQTEEKDMLNGITLACAKSKNIDIGTLMPEIDNILQLPDNSVADTEGTPVALASADGSSFSQSHYYKLTSVEFQNSSDTNYGRLERVGDSDVWRLTAGNQVTFDPIRINVKYALRTDPSVEYSKYFMFNIIANQAPKAKYSNITFVRYDRTGDVLRDLDDANTIRLEAWQLFSDDDDLEGTALRMLSVKSQVSSLVKASLSDDNRYLVLTFVARGESAITVEVTDETGVPVSLTFVASNTDLPAGSLWLRLTASFEANKVMWAIIIGSVLLLLIILIVIIVVLVKRKHAREELEALLVSEMEIEEQMLKLAGGPAPTGYESFGYLPPVAGAEQPNNALLGSGSDVPVQDMAALPPAPTGSDVPPPDGDNVI